MSLFRISAVIASGLVGARFRLHGQEAESQVPPASSPAVQELPPVEAAIRSFDEAYMAAFNKADAATVAAMYDETATYSSDNGKLLEGREAIEGGLKKYFEVHPGARIQIQLESVRSVTPDVAIGNGLAIFSASEGAEEVTRFKAVHAKRGDNWRIAELVESVLPPSDRGQLELGSLGWMVGAWRDAGGGDAVTTKVNWMKSGHFLRRAISVKHGGEETMQATEVIGWDSAQGQLRSWVFDSEGGFGEGFWSREGSRWIVKSSSTLPDGTRATALNIFTPKDDNTYTWESTSRELNGEVLPNSEKVEVVRESSAAKPPPVK